MSYSRYNRFIDKSNKIGKKYLKKTSLPSFLKTLGHYQLAMFDKNIPCKNIVITSNYFHNISTRRTIVNTLKEINYRRADKWTEKTAVAFIDEVFNLYLKIKDPNIVADLQDDISERYNVPINRFKTQVALFITNLENGKDKFNLLEYFSVYDIVQWKYRDLEKLQDDIENNRLSDLDKKLLQDLEII